MIQLKKISSGPRASIYAVSPFMDLYADDLAKFKFWLDTYYPNEYDLDGNYLTVPAQAEVVLALTFELV